MLEGFDWLFERLKGLGVAPKEMLVGLEATSRYGENLLQALLKHGYQVCLLHPAKMHAEASQRGLRARNGSARCHDYRTSAAQRRSALWLRTE